MRRNKKNVGRVLSLLLAGVLLVSGIPAAEVYASEAVQLYVSTEGSDGGQGTADDPLRTLEAARDKIRVMKENGGLPVGGVTVNIRGGEYPYLEDSFTLDAQDSGTESSPVVYRAYEGEEVKLVGNMIVEGSKFLPVTEEAVLDRLGEAVKDKVLVYDLKKENGLDKFAPIPKNGMGWPTQANAMSVLVDGEVQSLSRYPNSGFIGISSIQSSGFIPRNHMANPDGTCPECTKTSGGGKRIPCLYGENKFLEQPGGVFTVNNAELKAKFPLWEQETDIWTSGYFCWDWADDNCAIKAVEETGSGIKMTMRHPSRYGVTGGGRKFYAYNLLCEIDQPGEWYLDRENARLYLYPAKDLSSSNVELAMQTRPLVTMDKVKYVEWQNVTFAKSNGHGILMKDCENVEIAGCNFFDLGQRAVFMGDPDDMDVNTGAHGGSSNTVRSCDIARMGQGGIYLGGGNRYSLTPGNNKVVNCDISDFATIKRTYSPAVEMVGCGNSTERNRIWNAPHTAIMFSGNDMLIEGNDIFNVCYETADVGAIYSVRRWSYQGTLVKNNYIHDLINTGGIGSAAVYVDDLGSGVTMTENLLVNIPGYTTLFGGGRDNSITNNIQVNYGNGRGLQYDNRGKGWAWYHAAGPDGECYGELTALRANPLYDKEKWDEKYQSLSQIDLETYTIRSDKGDGFKYYYTNAAKPENAVIEKNILVGVANPFGNVNGDVKNGGSFKDNQTYAQGEEIGFTDFDSYNFTVEEDSLIKDLMGDNHFQVDKMGLYEDEFRSIDLDPMDQPELLAPADGTADVQAVNGVKFEWGSVDRAGSYTLEIARDEGFTDVVKSVGTIASPVSVLGLEKATTYYWRVTAREKRVNGAVSVSRVNSFATAENENTAFFEGFRDFSEWEEYPGKGTPGNTTAQAKSGRYSYELDQSMDAIMKKFGTKHNDVVTVWLYDNMNKANGAAGIVNVTRQDGEPWIGAGVSVATNGAHKDKYVVRIGGSWYDTDVMRTEGWHELKWDYTEIGTCKIYVDNTLCYTVEDAPYYDMISMGDFWDHSGYPGDVSGILFDHVTVGEPMVTEKILSITVPEESIKLYLEDTYQLAPVAEADPDVDVELEYISLDHEIARVDEDGLITPVRAGKTQITIQSVKDPAVKTIVQVEVSGEVKKDTLQTMFDQCLKYAKSDYTQESWDNLTKAMIQADDELNRQDSTLDSVKVAQKLLQAAEDALVFTAANLLANGGFEEGTLAGFGQYPAKNTEGITLGASSEAVHSGSYSAKITTTSSIPNYGHKGLMYTIPAGSVETGAEYTLSYWAKSEDGKERNMSQRIVFRKNSGMVTPDWVKVGAEWTYITLDIPPVPAGTDYIEMIMGNENTAESAGTYYIDDVCLQKKTTPVPAEGIRLDQEDASVSSGDAVTLTAAMIPENTTNDMMVWSSSDETVASVEKGKVTAKNPGQATITVRSLDGGFTAECTITVPVQVSGVTLSSESITAKPGQQFVLTAQVEPEDAANKNVSWGTSDAGVATVEDGVVTTVSAGDAVITVTTLDGGYTDTCEVTVEEPDPVDIPAASVSMSDAEITLKEGEEYDLTATVSPGDATNQSVTWSSSVGAVASVTDGHVKALSEGVTVITVTTVDGGHTAACRVTVEALDPGDIPVDKSLLQKTYDYAKTLDTTGVVDSAVKYFKDSMAAAEAVLADPEATKEEVLDTWNQLVKAIHGLGLLQGDKGTLEILVNRADGMVEHADKYVSKNWQKLLDALKEAKAVLVDGDAMSAQIKEAEDALLNAILIQRLKANKENLKDLIDKASSIDESLYTEESVQVFRSALTRAMAVLNNENLSEDDQQTVDKAEKELKEAIDQLEEKEGGNPTNPTDPSNPNEPTDPEDPSGPEDPGQPENPSEPEDSGDGAGGSDASGDGQDTGNMDGSGTNGEVKAPKTGDRAPFGMAVMIAGLGVLCIGGVVWIRKRKQ